jgi:DNA-directed RNA polymerase specialized sigma subunit
MHRPIQLSSSGRDCTEGLNGALGRVRRRILSWNKPSNWSSRDWFDEVHAMTAAARCRAELEYDPTRGVPLSAFLYLRALSYVWTRYRQECAYSRRFIHQNQTTSDRAEEVQIGSSEDCLSPASLQCALLELPPPDQLLIRQLFWEKTPEDKLATNLRISQQAVSKRKRKIIGKLRRLLGASQTMTLLK